MAKTPSKIMTVGEKKAALATIKGEISAHAAKSKELIAQSKTNDKVLSEATAEAALAVKAAKKVHDLAVKEAALLVKNAGLALAAAEKAADGRVAAATKAHTKAKAQLAKDTASQVAHAGKLAKQEADTKAAEVAALPKAPKALKALKVVASAAPELKAA